MLTALLIYAAMVLVTIGVLGWLLKRACMAAESRLSMDRKGERRRYR